MKHFRLIILTLLCAVAVGNMPALAEATISVKIGFLGYMNNGRYLYVIKSSLGKQYSPGEQVVPENGNCVFFDKVDFDLGSDDVPLNMNVFATFGWGTSAGDFTVNGTGNRLLFTSTTKYIMGASVATGNGEAVTGCTITDTKSKEVTIHLPDQTTFGMVTLTIAKHTPFNKDNAATIGDIEDSYLDDGVNRPVPTVTYKEFSNSTPITLTEGVDYTVSYAVGNVSGTVTITGIGDYTGEVSKRYSIRQLQLTDFNQLGDGSYEIATKQDLDNLAKFVNNNNPCLNVTFRQTADIAYTYDSGCAWDNKNGTIIENNANFACIGGYGKWFRGTYDGGGYSISGIRIYKRSVGSSGHDDESIGLFGYVYGGTVKNVVLRDANIFGHVNLGGIVGYLSGGGSITDCLLYHVRTASDDDNINIIVGCNEGGTISGTHYRDCCFSREVNVIDQSARAYYNFRCDDLFALTLADGITATPTTGESAVIDDVTYYTEGTAFTLGYTGGSETFIMPAMDVIPLLNGFDNTAAITANQGSGKNVILTSRTLYKDGCWNTLCLPFEVSTSSGTLNSSGVRAMKLNTETSGLDGSTLTLNFTTATSIPAGTPFIIKWESADEDILNPVFSDVTISTATNDATVPGVLTFKGTSAPVTIGSTGDNTKLYLGGDNTLYYPGAGASIGAQRAYFQLLGGLTAGNPQAAGQSGIKEFVLNFGEDDATSLNEELRMKSEESAAAKGWFDLNGRKLSGKPSQKGIYINNGRKVIIH